MNQKEALKRTMALTKPQHTPTPWTVMEGKTLLHIETANMNDGKPCGMPVCSIPKKRPQDAAFIVKAVNCHEELLEAAKCAGDALLANDGDPIKREAIRQLREAIAEAEARS